MKMEYAQAVEDGRLVKKQIDMRLVGKIEGYELVRYPGLFQFTSGLPNSDYALVNLLRIPVIVGALLLGINYLPTFVNDASIPQQFISKKAGKIEIALLLGIWSWDGISTAVGLQAKGLGYEGNYEVSEMLAQMINEGWATTYTQALLFEQITELSVIFLIWYKFGLSGWSRSAIVFYAYYKYMAGNPWNDMENDYHWSDLFQLLMGAGGKPDEPYQATKVSLLAIEEVLDANGGPGEWLDENGQFDAGKLSGLRL